MRDEREPALFIESEAMRMVGEHPLIALHDPLADGIDSDQLIPRLHGNENAVRYRVVVGVSRLTAQVDRRAFPSRLRVDHDISATGFVRAAHFVSLLGVRYAVRKPDVAHARRDLERPV